MKVKVSLQRALQNTEYMLKRKCQAQRLQSIEFIPPYIRCYAEKLVKHFCALVHLQKNGN